jgi:hypothetical protein
MTANDRKQQEFKPARYYYVLLTGSSYNSEDETRVDQILRDEYLNYGGPDQGSRLVWEDMQNTQDERK